MTGPFSILIKPASADCNLRCEYCFYLDKSALYPEMAQHRMTDDVLERLVVGYMATAQPVYAFGWQGGEPTLMGADFFRRVTELQKNHGRPGAVVSNGLQTNATLIDDALAAHLAEYNFLVGVSIDGPAEVHDRYRRNAAGRGSHADVLRGIDRLRRNCVEFNALTLVNAAHAGRGAEVYRYLRDAGILFHQYIPCVEFAPDSQPAPYSVPPDVWGDFLCEVFDAWYPGDTRTVSVRLFDSILALMVDGVRNVCHMAKDCRQYFLVEHNGDVYPCDFFVQPDLRLGNIMEDDWDHLLASEKYATFGSVKTQWPTECSACEYVEFCMGDCPKHRPAGVVSHLCAGWRSFFAYTLPRFRELAARVRAQRTPVTTKAGRNDPCPCGSGLKYKKCHGLYRE